MTISAPTQLAVKSANTNGQTSSVLNLGAGIPAGAEVVCLFINAGGSGYATAGSDDHSNAFARVDHASRNSQNWCSSFRFRYAAAPGQTTLTVTHPSSNEVFAWVGYHTGDDATAPKDSDGANNTFGGSLAVATQNPANLSADDEIAYAFCSVGFGTAPALPAGYTSLSAPADGVRIFAGRFAYRIIPGGSGAPESATFTTSGSRQLAAGIITFKPAAGGPTQQEASGTAAVSLTTAGAATARSSTTGTAAIATTATGAATARSERTGNAAVTTSATGAATARTVAAGTAAVATTATAAATATTETTGNTPLTITATGAATARTVTTGTAAVAIAASGQATARSVASSTAALTVAATGAATARTETSGTAAVSVGATGTGTVPGNVPASGTASITVGATGHATARTSTAGTAAIATGATGTAAVPGAAQASGMAAINTGATASATVSKQATGNATLVLNALGVAAVPVAATGTATLVIVATGFTSSGVVHPRPHPAVPARTTTPVSPRAHAPVPQRPGVT